MKTGEKIAAVFKASAWIWLNKQMRAFHWIINAFINVFQLCYVTLTDAVNSFWNNHVGRHGRGQKQLHVGQIIDLSQAKKTTVMIYN